MINEWTCKERRSLCETTIKITDILDVVIASLNLAKENREGKIYPSLYSSPLVKSKNDDRVDS